MHDQQEAEKKKATSQEIQEALRRQTKEIAEKKSVVLKDLAKVEPAVRDAQQGEPTYKLPQLASAVAGCEVLETVLCLCVHAAVKSIKRPHLVEIKNLPNPPKVVKLALESICLLLGEPTTDWRAIRSILMRENFIPTIVNFSTDDIRQASCSPCGVGACHHVSHLPGLCSDENRTRMKREFLADPQYRFETVNHASTACGPLVQWAIAQVCTASACKALLVAILFAVAGTP